MAEDNVKISGLNEAASLSGSEMIPFAKDGENGRTTIDKIVAKAREGMASGVPTKVSELFNDRGYITASDVASYDDTLVKNRLDALEEKPFAQYATKTDVSNKIQEVVGAAPEALSTLEAIAEKLGDSDDAVAALTSLIADKADRTELSTAYDDTAIVNRLEALEQIDTDHSSFVLRTELGDNFYTKAEIDQKIVDEVASGEIDLSNYLTKQEYKDAQDQRDTLMTDMRTTVSNKANTADVYTKTEIDSKGYLTEHQDLTEYAKKTDLQEHQPYDDTSIKERLTALEAVDHSGYLKSADIVDLASQTYVDNKIQSVVGAAPDALSTLEAIAEKLTDNDDVAGALTTAISTKMEKADAYTKEQSDARYLQSVPDTYATKSSVALKLDASTYEADKATFVTKAELGELATLLDSINGEELTAL